MPDPTAQRRQELGKKNSPLLKSPYLRGESFIRDFEKAFAQADVLISPTAPETAFKLGEKVGDPLAMYLADVMTTTVNLAGLPALSLPAGAIAYTVGAAVVTDRPLGDVEVKGRHGTAQAGVRLHERLVGGLEVGSAGGGERGGGAGAAPARGPGAAPAAPGRG